MRLFRRLFKFFQFQTPVFVTLSQPLLVFPGLCSSRLSSLFASPAILSSSHLLSGFFLTASPPSAPDGPVAHLRGSIGLTDPRAVADPANYSAILGEQCPASLCGTTGKEVRTCPVLRADLVDLNWSVPVTAFDWLALGWDTRRDEGVSGFSLVRLGTGRVGGVGWGTCR